MKKDWKHTFNSIRERINDWDPIGGTPEDEYDDLVFGIQSRLTNEFSEDELEKYVLDYLNDSIGIDAGIEEIKIKMKEIKNNSNTSVKKY